jgi:hypothetical protein
MQMRASGLLPPSPPNSPVLEPRLDGLAEIEASSRSKQFIEQSILGYNTHIGSIDKKHRNSPLDLRCFYNILVIIDAVRKNQRNPDYRPLTGNLETWDPKWEFPTAGT